MSASTLPARPGLPRVSPVMLRLLALLAGLVAVFTLLLGDRLFNGTALRSMAFQLPELGILSLAMMIPLLSGGLDLSIIASANLSALATAFMFTHVGVDATGVAALGFHIIAIAVWILPSPVRSAC